MVPVVHAQPPFQDGGGDELGGVGEVLGTLGLYAAMLTVLAVGTEVVVDMIRPIFGLQSKMTADEAFERLRSWLPQTMKELEVSEEAEKRLDRTVEELEEVTAQFGDRAERARSIVQERWPEVLKDLAVDSVDAVMARHWPRIERELRKRVGDEADTEAIRSWFLSALATLRAMNITDLQSQIAIVNGMLEAVKRQRNEIQGPLRKGWRAFRDRLIEWGEYVGGKYDESGEYHEGELVFYKEGKLAWFGKHILRHIFFLPAYIEYAWARFRGTLSGGVPVVVGIKQLGKVKFRPVHTLQEMARRVLEEDMSHEAEEGRRIKYLRALSAIIGVALAAILQVDSLQLLEPVLGAAANTFRPPREAGEVVEWYTVGEVMGWEGPEAWAKAEDRPVAQAIGGVVCGLCRLTPGVILSGLGAAAGSGFWHDQLDKLRNAKRAVAQIEEMTRASG